MNKHLYLCHLFVLSSPTLMMHGHTNLKFITLTFYRLDFCVLLLPFNKRNRRLYLKYIRFKFTHNPYNLNNNRHLYVQLTPFITANVLSVIFVVITVHQ